MSQLEVLDLSGNSFSSIPERQFSGLKSLRMLHLQQNHLHSFPRDALHQISHPAHVDTSYNEITHLNHSFLSSNIIGLNISSNLISHIHDQAFIHARGLVQLDLRDNRLREWPSQPLIYAKQLEVLLMGQNLFGNVPENALVAQGRLKTLTVNNCQMLQTVSRYAFSGCYQLESVDISENKKLHHIDPDAFESSSSLQRLSLRRNALTSLSEGLVPWFELKELDLSGNPWHCDCHLQWLPPTLRSSPERTRVYANGVHCLSPPRLEGRLLFELQPSALRCSDLQHHKRILTAVVCSLAVLALLSLLCLLYFLRHKIVDKFRKQYRYRRRRSLVNADEGNNMQEARAGDELVSEL